MDGGWGKHSRWMWSLFLDQTRLKNSNLNATKLHIEVLNNFKELTEINKTVQATHSSGCTNKPNAKKYLY